MDWKMYLSGFVLRLQKSDCFSFCDFLKIHIGGQEERLFPSSVQGAERLCRENRLQVFKRRAAGGWGVAGARFFRRLFPSSFALNKKFLGAVVVYGGRVLCAGVLTL